MRLSGVRRTLTDQSGFTLIELLGVAVILIILAVMALPVYAAVTDRTREGKTQEQLRIIEDALEAYHAQEGRYPDSLQKLTQGETSFLKKPVSFETPWSSPSVGGKKIYYYYAVDDLRAPTKYVIGDPGPKASCNPGEAPCGYADGEADPNSVDLYRFAFDDGGTAKPPRVRRSH